METLVSHQNPRIKQLVKLRGRRERSRSGLFLVEGYRECLRGVEGGANFTEVFYCKELFLGSNEMKLIESMGCTATAVSRDIFEKVSYRDRPDGVLGVARQGRRDIAELKRLLEKQPFLVVAEAIEKPGNLGSILRSCDGAGVDALIVADPCTDVHNPNVVRSSVGTLFTVPVFEVGSQEVIELLQNAGIKIISASPSGEMTYTECDMTGGIAIALGTEQLGLSELWMRQCDALVSIPMLGKADSLNVSNATTLMLYEAVRQRHTLSR